MSTALERGADPGTSGRSGVVCGPLPRPLMRTSLARRSSGGGPGVPCHEAVGCVAPPPPPAVGPLVRSGARGGVPLLGVGWCWLRQRQHNTQHAQITRSERKACQELYTGPRGLSQKGPAGKQLEEGPLMRRMDGNIIISYVIATQAQDNSQRDEQHRESRPSAPLPPHLPIGGRPATRCSTLPSSLQSLHRSVWGTSACGVERSVSLPPSHEAWRVSQAHTKAATRAFWAGRCGIRKAMYLNDNQAHPRRALMCAR